MLNNDKTFKLKDLAKHTEFTLIIIIVGLFILASVFTENFFSTYNITNLMKQCAIIGVLAVAQTIIISTGGIDISGGAITGLSCMVGTLTKRHQFKCFCYIDHSSHRVGYCRVYQWIYNP